MTQVRMGTFNTLGHSHTKPGGNARGNWAQAPIRTLWMITVLLRRRLGVVGLQEFQAIQVRVFRRNSRANPFRYHGYADNAVIWLGPRFKKVAEGFIEVPYFHGKMKRMPWVVLRKRALRKRNRKVFGFLCTHNPANVRGPAEHHRRQGWQEELFLVKDLTEKYGCAAVFSVGDKNDRDYDEFVKSHNGEVSHIPDIRGIDWIAGWYAENVEFKNQVTYHDGLVARISDHPLVVAVARF